MVCRLCRIWFAITDSYLGVGMLCFCLKNAFDSLSLEVITEKQRPMSMVVVDRFICDWVIIGAGIVGLSVAKILSERYPNSTIVVLEKESEEGRHASGRNSGVLHAGIYYSPETLKAKLCVHGRKLMSDFCHEYGLPLLRTGKVIIPGSNEDLPELARLADNAKQNGVLVETIDASQLREIEPEASTICGKALYSPETMVVAPRLILRKLRELLVERGVRFFFAEIAKVGSSTPGRVVFGEKVIEYGQLINSAGAFADKVAHSFGVGERYRIFPFRGTYRKLAPNSKLRINGNIYPVPDRRVPFLGVHFTPGADGNIYLGPTAMPAFGRENYRGLEGLDPVCGIAMAFPLLRAYMTNKQGMRSLVNMELQRLSDKVFLKHAQQLVPKISEDDIMPAEKRGIRAQLFDLERSEIVMDFIVEKKANTLHILNSISPAFTCGFSFAEHLVSEYLN